MRCYFCTRDENDISSIFSSLIVSLKKKKSELENQINEMNHRLELGIKQANFEKVKKIDQNILNMKINFFKDNFDVLIKLDTSLGLLKLYLNKFNPKISDTDTLASLANLYLKEPTDEYIQSLKTECISKTQKIISDIEKIHKNMKFHEITGNKNIDFTSEIKKQMMLDIIQEEEYYIEINKTQEQEKIFLCPFCWYLFDTNQFFKEVDPQILAVKLEQLKGKFDSLKEWDFD
jgi:hypothetical protein